MTTYLGKSCSFCLPRVPFINCRQFMYLVILNQNQHKEISNINYPRKSILRSQNQDDINLDSSENMKCSIFSDFVVMFSPR